MYSSADKQSTYNAEDTSSIPGLERSAGEGILYPLQYSWVSPVAQLEKNLPAMQVDLGLIPALGRSPGEGKVHPLQYSWASLVAQLVKTLPAMQETWVQSLGWEDPLEKGKATHSSILAWRIPWREEPGGLQSMGSQSRTRPK